MLESALALQKAASKGQELDELSITVPSDLRDNVLGGKFVDFTQLMAKSFLECQDDKQVCFVQDEQGRLIAKQERKTRTPLTIEQWMSAFYVFMSVYLKGHPGETQDMLAYIELIRGAAKDAPGHQWAQYDQQFRSRKEADPSRPWGMIDNQL